MDQISITSNYVNSRTLHEHYGNHEISSCCSIKGGTYESLEGVFIIHCYHFSYPSNNKKQGNVKQMTVIRWYSYTTHPVPVFVASNYCCREIKCYISKWQFIPYRYINSTGDSASQIIIQIRGYKRIEFYAFQDSLFKKCELICWKNRNLR